MSRALTFFAIGLLASSAGGAPPEAQVKAAVAKGASYLKSSYGGGDNSHGTGPDSLVGLALLEAGIPKADATVQKIASAIRAKSPGEDGTYQNALALLFFDRLGETRDEAMIQRLGTRLYLGMLASGGFDYQLPPLPASATPPPKPTLAAEKDNGFLKAKPKPEARRAAETVEGMLPDVAPVFLASRRLLLANGRKTGAGDNSNTQFGLIALWVAKRHGVPVGDALELIGKRFLSTQSAADGGWGYTPGGGNSTPAMTCAGVLGLAVSTPPPPPPPKDARAGDPFFNPPTPKARERERGSPHAAATRAGLASLTRMVATVPPTNLKSLSGLGDEYYTLWSLERACVALGLDSLSGADWHAWGCGFLLPAQKPDGSWQGQYGAGVSTSFAVLFLLRANFTKDLTERLKPKPAGGDAVLRGGLGFKPGERPDDTTPGLGAKGEAMPVAPEVGQLVEALIQKESFAATLAECRTGRGSAYTAAIVSALPKLAAAERQTARTALAERLTRMTTSTLKAQLGDPEAELRRAAAVAAGVKRDAELAPSLADRVADGDDEVAQAARLALRIISGRDFGPPPGADAAAKQKARGDWVKWAIAHVK